MDNNKRNCEELRKEYVEADPENACMRDFHADVICGNWPRLCKWTNPNVKCKMQRELEDLRAKA